MELEYSNLGIVFAHLTPQTFGMLKLVKIPFGLDPKQQYLKQLFENLREQIL